jgi:hypothetical protein
MMMMMMRQNNEANLFNTGDSYCYNSSNSDSDSAINPYEENGLPKSFQSLSIFHPPSITTTTSTGDQRTSNLVQKYNMADPMDVQRVRSETKKLLYVPFRSFVAREGLNRLSLMLCFY